MDYSELIAIQLPITPNESIKEQRREKEYATKMLGCGTHGLTRHDGHLLFFFSSLLFY